MYAEVKKGQSVKCPKCDGKGVFYGRGTVENGVFKGFSGKCFTCLGSGVQNYSDYKRCQSYYRNYAR